MNTKREITLSIPQPCTEDWDLMTTNEIGRHCDSCNKTVIDFLNYTDRELAEFFKKAKGEVCGRINNYQANRLILIIEQANRSIFHKLLYGTALASWLGIASTANAQSKHPILVEQKDTSSSLKPISDEPIYVQDSGKKGELSNSNSSHQYIVGAIVEKMPKFNGDLNLYLANNIVYPKEALDKGIEGKVYLTFVIEEDGSISGVKVIRGLCPSIDSVAMNVIRSMPNWIPGEQAGKKIRIQYNLPIHFSIADTRTK